MEGMMKLVYRIIIFSLVLTFSLLTYFAGIPHMIREYQYHRNGEVSTLRTVVSDEMTIHHDAIDKEWQEFYSISLKKKSPKKLIKQEVVSSKKKPERGKYPNPNSKSRESHSDVVHKDVNELPNPTVNRSKYNAGLGQITHDAIIINPENTKPSRKMKLPLGKKNRSDRKFILIYTYLHKSKDWYNLPRNATKDYLKRTGCENHDCVVTYDKDYLHLADVVLFHDRNTPSADVLRTLSTSLYRPYNQRWVYFTSETPLNSEYGTIPYNNFFNWTMTYRLDSDIFLPYFQYRTLDEKDRRPDPNINYAANKSGKTVWLVGNCKFAFRMDFAHLLSQYTDVYVGGGCRDQFEKTPNCTRWCDVEYIKTYKFYLAFENGICRDYITEKYARYLEFGLVPVVLGGANYSDPRLVIPGSFIDATSFKSVKELGDYLNYLDKNDTAYNEYFKWKQKYKIWHPPVGDWPFESYFLCKICQKLNQNLADKVYTKLSDFWNQYTDCEAPEADLRRKFIPSDYNFESRERAAEEKRRSNAAKISKDFDEDFS